jgi:tetratricopeptide (TPR) repeat protein
MAVARPGRQAAGRFQAAREAYEAGRSLVAYNLLNSLPPSELRFADAYHLMGLCLIDLGEFDTAEQALRVALSLDKRSAALHAALGDLLRRPTRFAEAEKSYRAALALDRRHVAAVVGLSRLLIFLGRYSEVPQLTAPILAAANIPAAVLEVQAEALKHLGRMDEALALNRRAVEAGSAGSQLEVAGVLRELGRYQDAEATARGSFATLGDAPAAFIVHGRTLQDLGRNDEAEVAYREALRRAPLNDLAHEHLGELHLGRTDDHEAAFLLLDRALAHQATPGLVTLKARMLVRLGKPDQAYALLDQATRAAPDEPSLHAAAAKTAILHDPALAEVALAHAERAHGLVPDVPKITAVLGETCLAAGRPERASDLAEKLLRHWGDNQALVALQAVAWRMLDDPRYRGLYDYDKVVGSWIVDTPKGWPNLSSFLGDLAKVLEASHDVPVDAFGMTRRDGLQTKQHNVGDAGSVIAAFHTALDAPIREHVARIGRGKDPLRSRNRGGYRTRSGWSVKTTAGSFHPSHLHTEGWLSSAFYVELPEAVEQPGRQGWIKFGEPGIPTRPKLEAEHYVKPDPGRFVLFPSYMWHGTLPFTGEGTRLIMSVDLAPASD